LSSGKIKEEDQSRSRSLRVLWVLSLVFSCGFGAGALVPLLNPGFAEFRGSRPWRNGEREETVRHLRKALVLSEDQAHAVAAELDEIAKLYGDLQDQMDDLRQDSRIRIMRILTPEQQKRLKAVYGHLATKPLDRQSHSAPDKVQGAR
jgi:hypothetical protein